MLFAEISFKIFFVLVSLFMEVIAVLDPRISEIKRLLASEIQDMTEDTLKLKEMQVSFQYNYCSIALYCSARGGLRPNGLWA